MRKSYLNRYVLAAVVSVSAAGGLLVAQGQPFDNEQNVLANVESGITKPFAERKLQFNQPGVITKVSVKVGDEVERDQLLAQQDITVEVAEKKPLEIEATSLVQETYAKADQGVNEQKYQRLAELLKTNNASKFEVEEARLAVERSKASVSLAGQERETAKARIASLDARIDLKTLKSPIKGYVQALEAGEGEVGGIDQQQHAMVVVQNDPLKVDVNIPVREVRRLKVGQTLQVRYTDEDNAPWQNATVKVMLPVADRGSQTRGIELELPNPNNKPAGLRVEVKLPDNVAAAGQ